MMAVDVPYDSTGRVRQKGRTRAALIDAARATLAEGIRPTMDVIAERAAVSRTTAYRYFPTLRDLLVATYPHIDRPSLLGDDPPPDAASRLALVADDQTRRIVTYEAEMRAVLRLSLAAGSDGGSPPPALPMNRGLRIGWIADALAPERERLGEEAFGRLVHAIGATLGIEAFVWLTDIAGRSRDEAASIMRSSAGALLQGALAASTSQPSG
jgi:AcrR family transcriptional regulator